MKAKSCLLLVGLASGTKTVSIAGQKLLDFMKTSARIYDLSQKIIKLPQLVAVIQRGMRLYKESIDWRLVILRTQFNKEYHAMHQYYS